MKLFNSIWVACVMFVYLPSVLGGVQLNGLGTLNPSCQALLVEYLNSDSGFFINCRGQVGDNNNAVLNLNCLTNQNTCYSFQSISCTGTGNCDPTTDPSCLQIGAFTQVNIENCMPTLLKNVNP